MSDLFGNHIVGFPTRRLIFIRSLVWNSKTFSPDFQDHVGPNLYYIILKSKTDKPNVYVQCFFFVHCNDVCVKQLNGSYMKGT